MQPCKTNSILVLGLVIAVYLFVVPSSRYRILAQSKSLNQGVATLKGTKDANAYLEIALLWQQAVLNDDQKFIAKLKKDVENMPRSVELELKKLCTQKKNANACAVLAWKYVLKPDNSRVKDYMDKACEYGHSVCCQVAGISYLHLCIKAPWCKKAERFLKKACDKNFRDACYRLGLMYISGCRGVKKDDKLGRDYLKKACILGHNEACKELEPAWKKFFRILFGKDKTKDKENVK